MRDIKGRLEGKVAIVIGAGSSGPGIGNGKATSILFAREGAKVLLVDADISRARETLTIIEDEGGNADVFQADVTQIGDSENIVESVVDRFGKLDILVNVVGILGLDTVVDVEEKDWDKIMDVNVKSVVLASKFAIPKMIESGGGSIINISSIAGSRAYSATPYTTSKAAINGLTLSMAYDHGKDNIRVNAIAPGAVYTPMVAGILTTEQRGKRMESSMLGTEGTGWDVGWASVYLASDESRWVTGTVLTVDAGITGMVPKLL